LRGLSRCQRWLLLEALRSLGRQTAARLAALRRLGGSPGPVLGGAADKARA